jgi:hypothetical protein
VLADEACCAEESDRGHVLTVLGWHAVWEFRTFAESSP